MALLSGAGRWLLLVFGSAYSRHAGPALAVFGLAVPAVALNVWSHTMLKLTRQLQALVASNAVFVLAVCGLAAAWVHRGLAWVALAWLVGNLAGGVAAVLPLMRCMRGTRRKHVAPGAPR